MQEITGSLREQIIRQYNEKIVPKPEPVSVQAKMPKKKKKKRKHPLFRNNFIPAPKGFTKPEEKNEFGIVKKDFGMTTKWGDRL